MGVEEVGREGREERKISEKKKARVEGELRGDSEKQEEIEK